jgi:hypothetical protein
MTMALRDCRLWAVLTWTTLMEQLASETNKQMLYFMSKYLWLLIIHSHTLFNSPYP